MKSPISQIHSAAIFPSPVFLWRFKVGFFFLFLLVIQSFLGL